MQDVGAAAGEARSSSPGSGSSPGGAKPWQQGHSNALQQALKDEQRSKQQQLDALGERRAWQHGAP
jgi:hypothetical protein